MLDLDGAGKLGIVFPPNSGYVFDVVGNIASSGQGGGLPMDLNHDGKWSFDGDYGAIFADLDGDGLDERMSGNTLVMGTGAAAPGWPVPTQGGCYVAHPKAPPAAVPLHVAWRTAA